MGNVTFRSRDIWKECVRLLHLTPTSVVPSEADQEKWLMEIEIDDSWVRGDPLMLQMMHEAAKPYELIAIKSVARLFTDYWEAISDQSDKSIQRGQLGILSDLAKIQIDDASGFATGRCRELCVSHRQAMKEYEWYRAKEGITFVTRTVTTGVSTGLTGLSLATGQIAPGVLGLAGLIKNVVGLANQICDWCAEAETIQKEINDKLYLLKKRYGGKVSGSKASVTGQEFVEGMFWETLGLGLDRNFGVNIKVVGDLVDTYGSKIKGIEKAGHQMARSLNTLLNVTEKMNEFIAIDKLKIDELVASLQQKNRIQKPKGPTSLVGHIDKAINKVIDSLFLSKAKRAKKNWGYLKSAVRTDDDYTAYWEFLKKQVTTRKQRKLLNLERKVHAYISRTIKLNGRVDEGKRLHRQYEHAMAGLQAKKAKGTDLAVKVTALLTWNLPQIFAFADYGKMATDAVEVTTFVTDLANEGLDNTVELSLWMSEKAVPT